MAEQDLNSDVLYLPPKTYTTSVNTLPPDHEVHNKLSKDSTYEPDPIYYGGKKIPYNKRSYSYTDGENWIIALNSYERNNLLALLNAIGYPWNNSPNRVVPIDHTLSKWNSGDWVGQVGHKLADPSGDCFSPSGNYYDEEPPTKEEWAVMQRMLKFTRGQLLKTPQVNDEG